MLFSGMNACVTESRGKVFGFQVGLGERSRWLKIHGRVTSHYLLPPGKHVH